MSQIVLDTEAGQVSAELVRRGIASHVRVRVRVEVADSDELPMAAIAQLGKGLDWLAEEPDLYSDANFDPVARVTGASPRPVPSSCAPRSASRRQLPPTLAAAPWLAR
jgi:hypothetical protein